MDEQKLLRRYGVRLFEGEKVEKVFDPRRGIVRRSDAVSGGGFLLTNHRLIHLSSGGWRRKANVAMTEDVRNLAVEHTGKNLLRPRKRGHQTLRA